MGFEGNANGRKRGFLAVSGKPAIVTDLLKAVWQDVVKESADEFFNRKSIGFEFVAVGAIAPGVGHMTIAQFDDTVVTDGDFVSIATEIFQDLPGAVWRRLGIYYPPLGP